MLLPYSGRVVYINENAFDAVLAYTCKKGKILFKSKTFSLYGDLNNKEWVPLNPTTLTLLVNKDIPTWESHLEKINNSLHDSSKAALKQQLEMFRNNIELPNKTFILDCGELGIIDKSKVLLVSTNNKEEPCFFDLNFNEIFLHSTIDKKLWTKSNVNDISLFLANDINFIKSYISNNRSYINKNALCAINQQTQILEDKINECKITLPTSLPTKVEEFSL